MTVIFDTLKLAKELRDEAGFPQQQAEGLARALSQASADNLATRTDIAEVRAEIAQVRAEMQQMKAELLKWFIALLSGQALFIVTLIKLL